MKKLKLLGLLLTVTAVHAQSTSENYIQSKTCLNGDCSKKTETVTYYDGLGRPKQVVAVKATTSSKDLVTPITYDDYGRQTKDILPVPANSLNAGIHTSIINENTANSYYGVANAYAEKEIENSPLDRVLQQAQPGDAWKLGGGHTTQYKYQANISGEVKKFRTSTTTNTVGAISNTVSSTPTVSSYDPGVLYKNTVTDEDGTPVIQFTDSRGQLLLIRRTDGVQNVDTYYIYNEYGQQVFVIPPKAVQQIEQNNNTVTQNILETLCYQYRYDGRGRQVEKRLPGRGDGDSVVYDGADRPILSQDANLKNKGQWLLSKYDRLGRVVYTGLLPGGSRTDMQSHIGNQVINEEVSLVDAFTKNGLLVYYTNTFFQNLSTVLTVNYYDYYPRDQKEAIPDKILTQFVTDDKNSIKGGVSTRSFLTASYVKNIEDDNWTKTYFYYDSKGRKISERSWNHLGGYTKTESKLDFTGVAQTVITRHKRLQTNMETVITENFEYDHQNRLLVHKHQVDSNPVEILTQNTYNEISQLESKKVGGIALGSPLQQIDYKYNIRGWMTKINDPVNLNGKLFGYSIKYNQVEGLETPNLDFPDLKVKPKFNGNIAEIDWKTSTDPNDYLRRYGYVYDPLNRLSAGFYQKNNNPSAKEYFEKLDYDANGNITKLKRSAELGQSTSTLIDDLTYTYSGNRLITVTDSSADYKGYPDTSGNTIEYDLNGNMINQKDKGILNIDYNYLNLPDFILFNKTLATRTGQLRENTQYLYRANGTKLRKTYNYAPYNPLGTETSLNTKITEYLDGFQYESSGGKKGQVMGMKFVPTTEGYYNFENNKYIYNYTDHLGNIRISYFMNTTGIEILEENNYYPFGLKHEGYNTLAGNPTYQYKYNGKELQAEMGMYDYGARMYMPDLGRWGVVDPLAEKSRRWSPYNYAFNNPIRFIDPDGRLAIDPIYGRGFWSNKLTLIGDDGKNAGKAYIVTGNVKKEVEAATKKGQKFSGNLSEGKNVANIPTGARLNSVIESVADTKKSGRENGGYAYRGDDKPTRSREGVAAKQYYNDNNQIITEASMSIFHGGIPKDASNLEMYWHDHPDVLVNNISPSQLGHSTPSDGVQGLLEERGFKGNAFVVGTRTNDVTYYNGEGQVVNVNYEDWKNAGIQTTVSAVVSIMSNLLINKTK